LGALCAPSALSSISEGALRPLRSKEIIMLNKKIVRSWIENLAGSQGFYGRLLRDIDEGDHWDTLVSELNERGVKDPVDMVMLLEG
jgi:hypothetical protein